MSNQIAELLPKLMQSVGSIGKDRRNEFQNYVFRGIDDVLNHVGPPCAELGVRVSPTLHDYQSAVTEWQEAGKHKFQVRVTLRLRLEFTAPDGSMHISEAVGEAIDTNGDKASNKAMSAAFKYACFMGLVIPVSGALDDSDTDDKQPAPKTPPRPLSAPKKATPAPKPGPVATKDQRERFLKLLEPVKEAACAYFGAASLESIDDSHIPTTKGQADRIMASIQEFMDQGQPPEPPTDGKSWRDFVLPFGKQKGKTLGEAAEQDRKYLLALAHKYTVDTLDKEGKPRPQNWIDKDQLIRDALDAFLEHERATQ